MVNKTLVLGLPTGQADYGSRRRLADSLACHRLLQQEDSPQHFVVLLTWGFPVWFAEQAVRHGHRLTLVTAGKLHTSWPMPQLEAVMHLLKNEAVDTLTIDLSAPRKSSHAAVAGVTRVYHLGTQQGLPGYLRKLAEAEAVSVNVSHEIRSDN